MTDTIEEVGGEIRIGKRRRTESGRLLQPPKRKEPCKDQRWQID